MYEVTIKSKACEKGNNTSRQFTFFLSNHVYHSLAISRNLQVILVTDPRWPHHPAGRAHFRLLWTTGGPEPGGVLPRPVLWLEAVNVDFAAQRAGLDGHGWEAAVVAHAVEVGGRQL